MRNLFALVIPIIAFFYLNIADLCSGTTHLAIHNAVPSGVVWVRCQSGDEDLNLHKLHPDKWYGFKVRYGGLFTGTLYFCHFYWEDKDISFDVYNLEKTRDWIEINGRYYYCFEHYDWEIREDGFWTRCGHCPKENYAACDWKHMYTWTSPIG
ncbi:hypothetical protein Dimus_023240 [Dionaea muscipula]